MSVLIYIMHSAYSAVGAQSTAEKLHLHQAIEAGEH